MSALAEVLHRATGVNVDIEILKDVVVSCAAALGLSLLFAMTYGVDLSAGFF